MAPALLPMAGIVALGFAVQAMAGFGNGLICVTLGAHFLPIPELVALVVPLSIVQTAWITGRNRHHLDRPLLLRRVLPLMGTGAVAGFVLLPVLGEATELELALGSLVVLLALRELWRLRTPELASPALPRAGANAAMLAAGVVHGLFATGGPLLVYALGQELPDRRRFRATLCAVWLSLNSLLIVGFVHQGRLGPAQLAMLPVLYLAMAVGTWGGDRLHDLASPRTFRLAVYGLLLLGGLSLLLR